MPDAAEVERLEFVGGPCCGMTGRREDGLPLPDAFDLPWTVVPETLTYGTLLVASRKVTVLVGGAVPRYAHTHATYRPGRLFADGSLELRFDADIVPARCGPPPLA